MPILRYLHPIGQCIALLAFPVLAAAQQMPPSGVDRRPAEISGIVMDSLRGKPLRNAIVLLEGTTTTVRTDSAGHFTISDISSGVYRLSAYHPFLDTLGMTLVTWPTWVGPGQTRQVFLSIPTGRGIATRFCLATQRHLGPAAIIGRLTVPDSTTPIDGTQVSFGWTPATRANDTTSLRQTTTNANGMYVLCGLPARTHGTFHASRPGFAAVDVPFTTGDAVLTIQPPVVLQPTPKGP